jgi:hypothetical protein
LSECSISCCRLILVFFFAGTGVPVSFCGTVSDCVAVVGAGNVAGAAAVGADDAAGAGAAAEGVGEAAGAGAAAEGAGVATGAGGVAGSAAGGAVAAGEAVSVGAF